MPQKLKEPSQADIAHRTKFKKFIFENAADWHRTHLSFFYEKWAGFNEQFFDGELIVPYLLLGPPSYTRAFADCKRINDFGGRSQIRIRPRLLSWEHPIYKVGSKSEEGRGRFLSDLLLHECVHQYVQEVLGEDKENDSYKGHGPHFRDLCNKVGAALALAPVRIAKARGKDKDLPSCANWPLCVRPAGYYLGAVSVVNGSVEPLSSEAEKSGRKRDKQLVNDLVEAALSFGEAAELNTEIEDAQEQLTQAAINLYNSQIGLSSGEQIEVALPARGENFPLFPGVL